MTPMILTSKIVIRRSCHNPTTLLSPRLSSPGVLFVCSCSPPGPSYAGSSPLEMCSCIACSVASSLACLAPSPFSWFSVYILVSSKTALGVRNLTQRSPHSSASRLWWRLTSPLILQQQACSTKKGYPHPSQFVGRQWGSRPSLQRTLSRNSCAESSLSSKKLGMMVIQAPDLHARSI